MPATIIIGAGVSGLQCAAAFLRLGHTVTVLEREEDVGGVWLRYMAFNVQAPYEFFCFPDFPCPPELIPEEHPTGRSLLRYIIAYARANRLYEHIVFRATVTRLHRFNGQWQCFYDVVQQGSGGGAAVTGAGMSGGGSGSSSGRGGGVSGGRGEGLPVKYRVSADFVVVATGLHATPFIPTMEGSQLFRGRVIHVHDLPPGEDRLAAMLRGRRVVVVGGTKTAMDVATRAAALGAVETVMVYRQAHWPISRYPLRGLHFTRLLHSRLAAAMLAPWHDAGIWGLAKGWVARPLRRLFWRTLERSLIRQHGLCGKQLPAMPLDADLLTGGLVADDEWTECLAQGKVVAVRGEPHRFTPSGIMLRSGVVLNADLVVMATGHRKDYSFIDADIRSKLGLQSDGLYLYRNVLPLHVRNIAFVGAEANSMNNPLTSYLQTQWLVACFQERVKLPQPAEMRKKLLRQTRWQRRMLPAMADRAAMIGMYSHHYHDRLMKDMGLPIRRKHSVWRECFEPYTAADYSGVAEDLWDIAAGGPTSRASSGSRTVRNVQQKAQSPSMVAALAATFRRSSAAANAALAAAAVGGVSGTAGTDEVPDAVPDAVSDVLAAPAVQLPGSGGGGGGAVTGPAAAGGGLQGDVDAIESEGRWISMSSSIAHDSPANASVTAAAAAAAAAATGSGGGPLALAQLSSSQLGASLSYNSRSGAAGPLSGTGRMLGTLYEQEGSLGQSRGGDGVPNSCGLRSAPLTLAASCRAFSLPHHATASLTPPDTPTQSLLPLAYGSSFRPMARSTVYVPPSSGRSCLMDAAALAMMDGVVGGALMDRPPRPPPSPPQAPLPPAPTAPRPKRTVSGSGDSVSASPRDAGPCPGISRGVSYGRLGAGGGGGQGGGGPSRPGLRASASFGAPTGGYQRPAASARLTPKAASAAAMMVGAPTAGSSVVPEAAQEAPAAAAATSAADTGASPASSRPPMAAGPVTSTGASGLLSEGGSLGSSPAAPDSIRPRSFSVPSVSAAPAGPSSPLSHAGGRMGQSDSATDDDVTVSSSAESLGTYKSASGALLRVAGGGGASGGHGGTAHSNKPRTLIQLVTTRHQHHATSGPSGSDGGGAGGRVGGGSNASANGSVSDPVTVAAAMGVAPPPPPPPPPAPVVSVMLSGGAAAAAVARGAVGRHGSHPFHEESEDFVGTPPSCFALPGDHLAALRHASVGSAGGGAGSRSSLWRVRRHAPHSSDDDGDGGLERGTGGDKEDDLEYGCVGRMDCTEGRTHGLVPVGREGPHRLCGVHAGGHSSESASAPSTTAIAAAATIHSAPDPAAAAVLAPRTSLTPYDTGERPTVLTPRGVAASMEGSSSANGTANGAPVPRGEGAHGGGEGGLCGTSQRTSSDCSGARQQAAAEQNPAEQGAAVGGGTDGGCGGGCGRSKGEEGKGGAVAVRHGGRVKASISFGAEYLATRHAATTSLLASTPTYLGNHNGSTTLQTSTSTENNSALATAAAAASAFASSRTNSARTESTRTESIRAEAIRAETNRGRKSVDSVTESVMRPRTSFQLPRKATAGGGTTSAAAPAAGVPSTNTPSAALQRYAARTTAAATFRMSLTNLADITPQHLKQAARASAAAAAMAAAMNAGAAPHSAPLHPLLLQQQYNSCQASYNVVHQSGMSQAMYAHNQATSRLGTLRGMRLSEEAEAEGEAERAEVPPGVMLGTASNDAGGGSGGGNGIVVVGSFGQGSGAAEWEVCDPSGGSMVMMGEDDTQGVENNSSGAGVGQSAQSNIVGGGSFVSGGAGGGRNATRRVMTSLNLAQPNHNQNMLPSGNNGGVEGSMGNSHGGKFAALIAAFSPASRAANGAAAAATAGGSGSGYFPPSFARVPSAAAREDGTQLSSPTPAGPGLSSPVRMSAGGPMLHHSVTAAAAATSATGSSWDVTFKQLSRAVVAPPQRSSGVLRAAKMSKRSMHIAERPSESGLGLTTPCGSGLFAGVRPLLEDAGSGIASGSGSGSGVHFVMGLQAAGSGGVFGGGPGLLEERGCPPCGPAALLVTPREPSLLVAGSGASRFSTPNNSGKNVVGPRMLSVLHASLEAPGSPLLGSRPTSVGGRTRYPDADAATAASSPAGAPPANHPINANNNNNDEEDDDEAASNLSSESSNQDAPLRRNSSSLWAAAFSAARELRIESESTRTAFAALVMAARTRRSCTSQGAGQHPAHESPLLAKLIAASQSQGPVITSRTQDAFDHAVAPTSPTIAANHGDMSPTSAAAATAAVSRPTWSSANTPSPCPSSYTPSGQGAGSSTRAGWDSGTVARSFKRLSGLLLNQSIPPAAKRSSSAGGSMTGGTAAVTAAMATAAAALGGCEDGGMVGVVGMGGCASGAGVSDTGGPVRLLRRMISSKRRSMEGPHGTAGGICTVDEEDADGLGDGMSFGGAGAAGSSAPTRTSAHRTSQGGVASAASGSYDISPTAVLAAAVLGHTTSRRSGTIPQETSVLLPLPPQ